MRPNPPSDTTRGRMIPTLSEKLHPYSRGHRSISTFQSAGERGSTQSPAQAPLSRVPQGPGRVPPGVWGSWTCPASPVFPCICSPCPIHLCPLQTPPFTQHFQLLRFTSSEEAPIPLHTGSLLPLGTPCPWGLPCHLSELTLFCTHRKLRLIEGKDSLDSFAPVE